MALGKQAKILTDKQVRAVLAELDTRRYPIRDRLMFLLSIKAGLRAKEVASVTWAMVTDAEGEVADVIALENKVSKGRGGGRHIPIHPDLKAALIQLHRDRGDKARSDWPVIHSERDRGLSAAAVVVWFHRLYGDLVALAIPVGEASSHARPGRSARSAAACATFSNLPAMPAWGRPPDTSRPMPKLSGRSSP
jgi:integrase